MHLFPAHAHPSPQTSTLHGTASLPTAPFSHELCFINSFCVSNPTSASSAQNCHSDGLTFPTITLADAPQAETQDGDLSVSIMWLLSLGDQAWAVCCAMPGNTCRVHPMQSGELMRHRGPLLAPGPGLQGGLGGLRNPAVRCQVNVDVRNVQTFKMKLLFS